MHGLAQIMPSRGKKGGLSLIRQLSFFPGFFDQCLLRDSLLEQDLGFEASEDCRLDCLFLKTRERQSDNA
jgi:hypothetical protein